jgi:DNA-binding NarL/FixJ family response regulator
MGVRNFLTKECDKGEVIDAVRAAYQGQTFFCRKIVNRVLENTAEEISDTSDCRPVQLSARELDIVRLIGKGYTTKEIADKVFLSPHTIGTHRKNIFRKLGVKSASELLMYSIRSGLIEAGE